MVVGLAAPQGGHGGYLTDGFEQRAGLLSQLGPHTIGKSCLYLKKVDDVNLGVLEQLIAESVQASRNA